MWRVSRAARRAPAPGVGRLKPKAEPAAREASHIESDLPVPSLRSLNRPTRGAAVARIAGGAPCANTRRRPAQAEGGAGSAGGFAYRERPAGSVAALLEPAYAGVRV